MSRLRNIGIAMSILLLATLAACNIRDKKTTLTIVDNNRHYYPVLRGQKLDMVFTIKNTGKNPFIMSDLMTSCGCITTKKSSIKAIPPGKEGLLFLTYNSAKNIGYVKHYITLYGNLDSVDMREIVFDVNVVPESAYTKDYEEVYQQEKDKQGGIKDLVEGNENNKGYYLDKKPE